MLSVPRQPLSRWSQRKDLLALGEHLHHCSATPRPLMRLRCAAESMNGFVSARLVTTLALLSLPFVVLALLL